MNQDRRGANMIGPLLLVALGVVLLLNNLGFIPWSFWDEAWQYWPVLLILAGAAFLIDRNTKRSFHLLWWVIAFIAIGAAVTVATNLHGDLGGPGGERLSEVQSFSLQTSAEVDAADSARVELSLRRGTLNLTAGSGEHLLEGQGYYGWTSDEPSLSSSVSGGQARVNLRCGRSVSLSSLFESGNPPRYEFTLGQPEIPHEFDITINSGTADLELAGIAISGYSMSVNSGHCEATFGANETACSDFSAKLNSGSLDLAALGGLGAERYAFDLNSGSLSADFSGMKPDAAPDLRVTINSGVASFRLPQDAGFKVDLRINSGGVSIKGQSYGRGSHTLTIGGGAAMGTLRIEINSGTVRID